MLFLSENTSNRRTIQNKNIEEWTSCGIRDGATNSAGYGICLNFHVGSGIRSPPIGGLWKCLLPCILKLFNLLLFTERTCWWNFMMIVKNEQTNVNSVHGYNRIFSGDVWFWCKHTYWEVKASIPLNYWVYYIISHVISAIQQMD